MRSEEAKDRAEVTNFPFRPLANLTPDTAAVLCIVACWGAAILLVNPVGEFPSVDDWSYASAVKALVEHGEIRFSDWTGANLIAHVIWGSLFALPLGATYTVLRISTLIAALLAAVAFFRLIREIGWPSSIAFLSALLLLFNPILFPLSFTFMTDVAFMAAQIGAMLLLLARLRGGSPLSAVAGWGLAVFALFTRQAALVIPIAFALAYLVKHGVGVRQLIVAALPIAVFVALQWGYELWLDATDRTPALYNFSPLVIEPSALLANALEATPKLFFSFGFFLLPVLIPVLAAVAGRGSLAVWMAAAVAAITCAVAISFGLQVPLARDIRPNADGWGQGPPLPLVQISAGLASAGGVLLVVALSRGAYLAFADRSVGGDTRTSFTFGLVGAGAFACAYALLLWKFDRYLVGILPWLALAALAAGPKSDERIPRWSLAIGAALIVATAGLSVAATHNSLAEKRVQATALAWLLAQGIEREDIDAGWVFNGDALYDRYGIKPEPNLRDSKDAEKHAAFLRRWYQRRLSGWYRKRLYVVGTKPPEGYSVVRVFQVPRWAMWGRIGPPVTVSVALGAEGSR